MSENNYQITIPYKEYKRLREKESTLKILENNIKECFEIRYANLGKPIPIHKNKLIQIGKNMLPFYCKNANYVEV